jgi:hypothetical protein
MILNILNNSSSIVDIKELSLSLPPGEEVDLSHIPNSDIASSDSLILNIATGVILVDDGSKVLSSAQGIRYILGQDTEPRDGSGKAFFHPTVRPFGTKVHFTGSEDSDLAVSDIGSGNVIEHRHSVGDPLVEVKYYSFNTILNVTHIQEGLIQCWNTFFDKMTVEFVPRVVTTVPGEATPYLYDPSVPVILPSEIVGGNGNVVLNEDITAHNGGFVQALPNENGVKPPAYWNATFDPDTGLFSGISPAPNGDGDYNLFHTEYVLSRFGNRISMLSTMSQWFRTDDSDSIPHGTLMRLTFETSGEDHEWGITLTLKLHRTRSC